jgi:hypothetical protein
MASPMSPLAGDGRASSCLAEVSISAAGPDGCEAAWQNGLRPQAEAAEVPLLPGRALSPQSCRVVVTAVAFASNVADNSTTVRWWQ